MSAPTDDLASAYAELGLPPTASDRDVKVAWRRLVSRWHPDRNADADAVARLQRLNAAFERLRARSAAPASDEPVSPATSGAASPASSAAGEAPDDARDDTAARTDARTDADAPAPDEADAAQAAREPEADREAAPDADGDAERAAAAGDDDPAHRVQRTLKLDLEAAALGCTRTLRGQWRPACPSCQGRGRRRKATACPQCEGRGRVPMGGWFGWMATLQDCPACAGAGRRHEACPACDGRGTGAATRWQVRTRIPPGVRDGDRLRVKLAPTGAGPGPAELLLRIALQPHPFLALHDDGELHCEVPVDGFAWIAERPLLVPTPGGTQTLTLRREQRHYRLPGQGFPRIRRGPRGDLHVHVVPLFPERLSDDQQILVDQLLAAARGPQAERIAKYQRRLRAWAGQARPDADD